VVRFAGKTAERVGHGRDDTIAGLLAESLDEAVVPLQFEDDDGRGVVVAGDPGVLVGDEKAEHGPDGQPGQGVYLSVGGTSRRGIRLRFVRVGSVGSVAGHPGGGDGLVRV
jgi:hypothetical protein